MEFDAWWGLCRHDIQELTGILLEILVSLGDGVGSVLGPPQHHQHSCTHGPGLWQEPQRHV